MSRQRTFLTCGKPDWCSFTPDEKNQFAPVFQTKQTVLAATDGEFSIINNLFPEIPQIYFIPSPQQKKPELASVEIRDFLSRN